MTGTSCAFIFTKSSDLPFFFFFFFFFLHMYDYAILDSGYYESSDYVEGFDQGDI
jgi:hypothetical protein